MTSSFVRKHAGTIVLSVLAAAGAVVVLVVDKDNVTTQESEHRKRNIVPVWRPDDIQSVTLTARGKTAKVSLGAPTDAGQRLWEVEIDGGRFLASQQKVDQLLGTLEYATFERQVSKDAVSEAELGLGSPATVVAIEIGPKTYRVAVGGPAPTPKDARYCEGPGGTYVITSQLASALDMHPDELRTRTFVPYLSTELKGLRVEGEGGVRPFARATWSGSRGAGFRFDGSTPEGDVRADAEAIDRLLGALGSLQAETFLADDAADKALAKRATITLAPRDGGKPKAVIEVGGACPGKEGQVVAVRREPSRTSACVPAEVMDVFVTPAPAYIDLGVIGARADEVSELTITQGDRTIEIARSGTGWHMRKPSDRKVSAAAGNELVNNLTSLAGAKIVTGAAKDLGLDPPRATVRAESTVQLLGDGAAAERVETIEIGAPQGDVVHVRRLEDGAILALPADRMASLAPSEVVLRDAGVLDLKRDQVRALTVEVAAQGGARTQRLARGLAGWTFSLVNVPDLEPDVGLVEDLLEPLVTLKAVRWVAEKDDGTFGLDRPRITLEMKVAEDAAAAGKTVRVELGAATKDGVFARTGDDPAVFVAPRPLEEAATRWLFDRQALVIDEGALVRIEAAAEGGKTLVAERQAGPWQSAAGADAAATLRSAVTGLIAEGVVATGRPDRSFGLEKPRMVLTVLAEVTPGDWGSGSPAASSAPNPGQGAAKGAPRRKVKIAFGAGDTFRGTSVVYARRDDIDATFAVALGRVRALLQAAGVE
jgi:hypothetical protein